MGTGLDRGYAKVSGTPKPWTPLFIDGAGRSTAHTLDEIVDALAAHFANLSSEGHHSLALGPPGVALLLAYLSAARPDRNFGRQAAFLLEQSADAIAEIRMGPELLTGFPGVAWALAHASALQVIDLDDDFFTNIDSAVDRYLAQPRARAHVLSGMAIYALERLPAPAAVPCLDRIVEHLVESATHLPSGATWLTDTRRISPEVAAEWPQGYSYVGAAHGVAGVIVALAAISANGIATTRADPLLERAVEWLLSQKNLVQGRGSFPRWIAPDGRRDRPGTAWCRGAPGIAGALFTAARAMERPDWEREALSIARDWAGDAEAHRRIVDASLCHGAAGVGHIFNRLYQATGDADLGAYARIWLTRASEMRNPRNGPRAFQAARHNPDGSLGWYDDWGFSTGTAGTCHALLGAVTAIEPNWDRLMSLSVRIADGQEP